MRAGGSIRTQMLSFGPRATAPSMDGVEWRWTAARDVEKVGIHFRSRACRALPGAYCRGIRTRVAIDRPTRDQQSSLGAMALLAATPWRGGPRLSLAPPRRPQPRRCRGPPRCFGPAGAATAQRCRLTAPAARPATPAPVRGLKRRVMKDKSDEGQRSFRTTGKRDDALA